MKADFAHVRLRPAIRKESHYTNGSIVDKLAWLLAGKNTVRPVQLTPAWKGRGFSEQHAIYVVISTLLIASSGKEGSQTKHIDDRSTG